MLVQISCECSDLIRLSGMIFPTPELKMCFKDLAASWATLRFYFQF